MAKKGFKSPELCEKPLAICATVTKNGGKALVFVQLDKILRVC
jgi:hypothetical protein